MSFLTGLYLLGAATIAFPIVFHLIRRRPQQRLPFSSLMFLNPSPPRLTQRSRLDHLLLLLLRALALLLVTIAFMRPFYRQTADATLDHARGRRVAILLDTSASMRRGDLWPQAVKLLETHLDQLPPGDDVALLTFDDDVTTIVGFSEAPRDQPERRRSLIRDAIPQLAPTWAHTEMASALIIAAESIEVINDRTKSNAAAEILLISDMQEGSRLQGLDGYQWPQDVQVSVQSISSPQALSNASLRVLTGNETENDRPAKRSDSPGRQEIRVRVENAPDATTDQFDVRWGSAETTTDGEAVSIYVPAGQSRVLRMPQAEGSPGGDRLVLSGDDAPYDNQYFVLAPRQEVYRCLYVGADKASDPEGLLFYLSLALPETRRTSVEILVVDQEPLHLTGPAAPRVVVVGKPLSTQQQQAIEQYVQHGGTVLAVVRDQRMLASLGAPFEGWTIAAADAFPKDSEARYALLGEIDFEHELMAAFAGSGYSDFTMIRFWHYRQLVPSESSSARVLASFDNGHPAFIELNEQDGRFLLLASGWNPQDSQLARSWKFAVLLSEILRHAGVVQQMVPSWVVNQHVQLPTNPLSLDASTLNSKPANQTRVFKPDGSEVVLGAGESQFRETNLPGIYRATWPAAVHEFAVNLAASESRTAPLAIDQLEALGVRLGRHASRLEESTRLRRRQDIELESEQQVWRWLILTALLLLIFETWLASHYADSHAEQTVIARRLVTES